MRAFVQYPLAFAIVSLAALLSGRALAQADSAGAPAAAASSSAEPVEEVTVRGRKTLGQYRLELERARDEIFEIYNQANEGNANDINCRKEQPTGSRTRQTVCRSNAENEADATAARDFLNALVLNAGKYRTNLPFGAQPDSTIVADNATKVAQGDGQSGGADALAKFEQEWVRILSEDRQLYRAVVKYAELEDEYNAARGVTGAPEVQAVAVVLEEPVQASAPTAPACEATTLTEYSQRNNVARVLGTVSIANCPAATSGELHARGARQGRRRRDQAARVQRDVAARRRGRPHFHYGLPHRRERRAHERARARLDLHLRRSGGSATAVTGGQPLADR